MDRNSQVKKQHVLLSDTVFLHVFSSIITLAIKSRSGVEREKIPGQPRIKNISPLVWSILQSWRAAGGAPCIIERYVNPKILDEINEQRHTGKGTSRDQKHVRLINCRWMKGQTRYGGRGVPSGSSHFTSWTSEHTKPCRIQQ